MHTIAAIDVGSNALRMMIGNLNQAGQLQPVVSIRLPVRLGQDVFDSGVIQEKTMRKVVEAFIHFQRVAQDHDVARLRSIATSAMREATNRDVLLDRIARTTGIDVEIISGTEEARLIHLAVASMINLKGKRAVLIDVGGGSVEVTLSDNRNIVSTESYAMGAVRLLHELNGHHETAFALLSPQKPFSKLVREHIESARWRIQRQVGDAHINVCVGTGGAAEDLGRLRQRRFKQPNDRAVTLSELQGLIEMLDGMSIKERIRKLGLRPDRADVILPAAVVLQLIAREARARRVIIPQVGVKDGVLLEMAEDLKSGRRAPRREQVLQSAMHLGRKYQFDARHSTLTARLARGLFDQSRELHNLGDEERLLLETAALLHDIGHFIDSAGHPEHGYYILRANRVIGLNDREQDVVANLVRYHRGAAPLSNDPSFKRLPQKERITLSKLIALLRLADGMDAGHASRIRDLVLTEKKKHWQLTLRGRGDLTIERWEVAQRRSLFEEIFGTPLEIKKKK